METLNQLLETSDRLMALLVGSCLRSLGGGYLSMVSDWCTSQWESMVGVMKGARGLGLGCIVHVLLDS